MGNPRIVYLNRPEFMPVESSYEELLRQADQALIQAQADGRNRVVMHDAGNQT